ncbi:Na+ driven multidrug efflux pump [Spironucleus salmonicida]|uniref:Na+ driven multidrug efflux pump n=1 Tax=Spironucleus salmonicida TaxID=348837 RepID=V6LCE8_9EUKA|nr:Na+ driven multidrug efflux pump [Spironucleus salmonicida]|eukprot:EST41918.1 Na+ driven multidrug efflux pump [Spironucleus salmonicida]
MTQNEIQISEVKYDIQNQPLDKQHTKKVKIIKKGQCKKDVSYLGDGPIFKVLIYQSYNNLVGYLVLTLYMIVGSVFIGQYLGEAGLASSSVGTSLEQLVCITVMQSLSVGAISLIGPALGQNRIEDTRNYATQFFMLVLLYNIVMPIIILPLKDIIARGLGATTEPVFTYLSDYMWIMYSIGVLAYTINGALLPLLRQENKVKEAMICLIVSSFLNIIMDSILFNFFLDTFKMQCAAISTVVSQLVVDIWILFNFFGGIKSTIIRFDKKYIKFSSFFLKTTFKQFIPAAFNTIPAIIAQALTSSQISKYAGSRTTQYQAVWGIFLRISQLMAQPRMGIYFGFLAILSYNLGQSKYQRIQKLILYADWMTLGILFVVQMLIIGLMPYLISMFDSNKKFVSEATPLLRLSYLGMFVQGSIMFASGVFQMRRRIITATCLQIYRLIVNVVTIYVLPLFLDIKWIFIIPTVTEISGFIVAQFFLWQQTQYFRKLSQDEQIVNKTNVSQMHADSGLSEVKQVCEIAF